MILIPYSSLDIPPDRQRKEFDPVSDAELANSIQAHGLLHPIAVEPVGTRYLLIAGERRLRQVKQGHFLGLKLRAGRTEMPKGYIAAILQHEMSALEREEIELDENLKRKDLTWQERAAAIGRLESLRNRQAAEAGIKPPTIGELAKEVYRPDRDGFKAEPDGYGESRISKEIMLAKKLPVDRDLAKAKTLDEAWKMLKAKETAELNISLARRVGASYNANLHQIYQADCRVWMRDQPPGQFDVVVTDPPYGIDADSFGDSDGRLPTAHQYSDNLGAFQDFLLNLGDISRLCKEHAAIFIFCDIDNFRQVRDRLQALRWNVSRTPIVYHKINSGRVPIPGYTFRRECEFLSYAWRGRRELTGVYPDIFAVAQMEKNLGHGAQKSVGSYLELLRRSARPGEKVFDPYCGSGTIFEAATELKLYATGCEKDSQAFGIAVRGLEALRRGEKRQ